MEQEQMIEKDVSKKTVVVLLVITIIVSALGVWTVLDKMNNVERPAAQNLNGEVSLVIIPQGNSSVNANANLPAK